MELNDFVEHEGILRTNANSRKKAINYSRYTECNDTSNSNSNKFVKCRINRDGQRKLFSHLGIPTKVSNVDKDITSVKVQEKI